MCSELLWLVATRQNRCFGANLWAVCSLKLLTVKPREEDWNRESVYTKVWCKRMVQHCNATLCSHVNCPVGLQPIFKQGESLVVPWSPTRPDEAEPGKWAIWTGPKLDLDLVPKIHKGSPYVTVQIHMIEQTLVSTYRVFPIILTSLVASAWTGHMLSKSRFSAIKKCNTKKQGPRKCKTNARTNAFFACSHSLRFLNARTEDFLLEYWSLCHGYGVARVPLHVSAIAFSLAFFVHLVVALRLPVFGFVNFVNFLNQLYSLPHK